MRKFKANNQTKDTPKNDLKMLKIKKKNPMRWFRNGSMVQGEWYEMKKATVTPKSF